MLQQIIEMVRDLVGEGYLYFDKELQIKMSPHTPAVNLWAASISPAGDVFVMDSNEVWYPVIETDEAVLQSLYQRIKLISITYKKAV